MAKGQGFSEERARRVATQMDGIAVPARPRPEGGWTVAGQRGTTWIVLDAKRVKVLADG